jgi:hypothetical protein
MNLFATLVPCKQCGESAVDEYPIRCLVADGTVAQDTGRMPVCFSHTVEGQFSNSIKSSMTEKLLT